MALRLLITFTLFTVAIAKDFSPFSAEHMEQWESFKVKFEKKYESKIEEGIRLEHFVGNLLKIAEHNQLYEDGKVHSTFGINQFSDWSEIEFLNMLNLKGTSPEHDSELEPILLSDTPIPDSIDWVKLGAVTPVKNQGQCGSCWAFSTTGTLEGQHFLKSKQLVSLSEQNLMDCSQSYGNLGCTGGIMWEAMEYVRRHGIDTEKSYPYEAREGKCRFKAANVATNVTRVVRLPKSEDLLKKAVGLVGPISVGIDASQLQHFKDGVDYFPGCSSHKLNHGVLAVGYGTNEKGIDYWLVKNSWGTDWGNKGYFKLIRNKNNNCGIATDASYPIV